MSLIFTFKTYHFVAVNVTSDICQINQQNIHGCSVSTSRVKMFLIIVLLPCEQQVLIELAINSGDFW
jgi:hypothetical protein